MFQTYARHLYRHVELYKERITIQDNNVETPSNQNGDSRHCMEVVLRLAGLVRLNVGDWVLVDS